MKKESFVITLWAVIIPIAIIGVYFLAPLMDWKDMDEKDKLYLPTRSYDAHKPILGVSSPTKIPYVKYCFDWWKVKILESKDKQDTVTYTGTKLPEVTITPNKN